MRATTARDPDWSFMDNEKIVAMAESCARYVAKTYDGLTTADDLHHEALIFLATYPQHIEKALKPSAQYTPEQRMWYLNRWLYGKLTDKLRPVVRHAEKFECQTYFETDEDE